MAKGEVRVGDVVKVRVRVGDLAHEYSNLITNMGISGCDSWGG